MLAYNENMINTIAAEDLAGMQVTEEMRTEYAARVEANAALRARTAESNRKFASAMKMVNDMALQIKRERDAKRLAA